ncbi:hypothetical protein QJQ45_005566 [Haematococcus lacustris]|nr:hypothetical protein QJQ45_005566 [Haematococcus lacustris]
MAKKKRQGTDKQQKGPGKKLKGLLDPSRELRARLARLKENNDRNARMAEKRRGAKWRPLELCYWPEQGALPSKGKEYPGLGYKRLQDKPPKAQQQQQPAEAQ